MEISTYYLKRFRSDLHRFLDDSSLPYFGHGWQHDCRELYRISTDRRAMFLICLYFTVLVDQAMHCHFHHDYPIFESLTRYPKFCYGLAQFHLNPRGILSSPVDQGLVSNEEVGGLLQGGMELFVDEVIDFLQTHMPQIAPERFFDKLLKDPDVQIPLLPLIIDETLRDSVEYVAYITLKSAVQSKLSQQKSPDDDGKTSS